jgi:hypothetical protein
VTLRRVLLDENMPVMLRRHLTGVIAVSAEYMGWKGLRNGALLRCAADEGFAVLLTADRPLAFSPRVWTPLGCVYVTSNDINLLRPMAELVAAACRDVLPGQVVTIKV